MSLSLIPQPPSTPRAGRRKKPNMSQISIEVEADGPGGPQGGATLPPPISVKDALSRSREVSQDPGGLARYSSDPLQSSRLAFSHLATEVDHIDKSSSAHDIKSFPSAIKNLASRSLSMASKAASIDTPRFQEEHSREYSNHSKKAFKVSNVDNELPIIKTTVYPVSKVILVQSTPSPASAGPSDLGSPDSARALIPARNAAQENPSLSGCLSFNGKFNLRQSLDLNRHLEYGSWFLLFDIVAGVLLSRYANCFLSPVFYGPYLFWITVPYFFVMIFSFSHDSFVSKINDPLTAIHLATSTVILFSMSWNGLGVFNTVDNTITAFSVTISASALFVICGHCFMATVHLFLDNRDIMFEIATRGLHRLPTLLCLIIHFSLNVGGTTDNMVIFPYIWTVICCASVIDYIIRCRSDWRKFKTMKNGAFVLFDWLNPIARARLGTVGLSLLASCIQQLMQRRPGMEYEDAILSISFQSVDFVLGSAALLLLVCMSGLYLTMNPFIDYASTLYTIPPGIRDHYPEDRNDISALKSEGSDRSAVIRATAELGRSPRSPWSVQAPKICGHIIILLHVVLYTAVLMTAGAMSNLLMDNFTLYRNFSGLIVRPPSQVLNVTSLTALAAAGALNASSTASFLQSVVNITSTGSLYSSYSYQPSSVSGGTAFLLSLTPAQYYFGIGLTLYFGALCLCHLMCAAMDHAVGNRARFTVSLKQAFLLFLSAFAPVLIAYLGVTELGNLIAALVLCFVVALISHVL